MLHMPESRFAAFAAHLFLSASLFLSLALFTYFILLPGFLFYSEGGSTILGLIGSIDVVLGPLITLIIYKKSKPGIKMDLSIIAIIQVTALLYGLYSLWSVRPIAVFYALGEYKVVYNSTFAEPIYTDISNNKALNRLKTPTFSIQVPEGSTSLQSLSFSHAIQTGTSYFAQEGLYENYQSHIPLLKEHAISPQQAVENLIISKKSPLALKDEKEFGFFRFRGSLHAGYILLNLKTGEYVDIVI